MPAPAPIELESLYVTITARYQQYMTGMQAVEKQFLQVEKLFLSMAGTCQAMNAAVNGAAVGMTNLAASMASFNSINGANIAQIGKGFSQIRLILQSMLNPQLLAGLPALSTAIHTFNGALSVMPTTNLLVVGKAFQSISNLLNTSQNWAQLPLLGRNLYSFMQVLSQANTGSLMAVTNTLNAAAAALNAARGASAMAGAGGGGGVPVTPFMLGRTGGGFMANFLEMSTGARIATGAILLLGVASVRALADFDNAVARSAALMGDTSIQMRTQISDLALSIARNSMSSATDLAGALGNLRQSGLSAADAMSNLGVVEQFTIASGGSLRESVTLLTDVMHEFNLSAGQMEHIGDVIARASQLGGGSMTDLAEGLARAGNQATALGMSLEQTTAFLAILNQHGIHGAAAGSQLVRVFSQIQSSAITHASAWHEIGVQVYGAGQQMRPMMDIVTDLQHRLSGMSEMAQRFYLVRLGLGSAERGGMRAITALFGQQSEFNTIIRGLENVTGALSGLAGAQLGSVLGGLRAFLHTITEIAISLGYFFVPALQVLTIILRAVLAILNAIPNSVKVLIGWIIVLYPLWWVLAMSVSAASMGFVAFNMTLATTAFRFLAIAAAVLVVLDLISRLSGEGSSIDRMLDTLGVGGPGGAGASNTTAGSIGTFLAYAGTGAYLGSRFGPYGAAAGAGIGALASPQAAGFFEQYPTPSSFLRANPNVSAYLFGSMFMPSVPAPQVAGTASQMTSHVDAYNQLMGIHPGGAPWVTGNVGSSLNLNRFELFGPGGLAKSWEDQGRLQVQDPTTHEHLRNILNELRHGHPIVHNH